MKYRKLTAILVTIFILLGTFPAVMAATVQKTIYVSPNGSDSGNGTASSPYKTLARAQEAVRAENSEMTGDIVVRIAGGTYYLDEPLSFRTEDSGTKGHRVIWQGVDRPVISGGKEITGFTPSQAHPGLYEASVDGVDRIMQIYVNGKKRWMARNNEFVKGVQKNGSYNWDDPNTSYTYDGIYMSKEDIGFWENPNDILFEWERGWRSQITYPEEFIQDPDNADQVIVRLQRGFWQILYKQNSQCIKNYEMYPDGAAYFRIINAMELLDSPGEFYYNRATKKLYYMPEADEDMSTAQVIVPRIDHFATIYGNNTNDCVKNIDFKGLTIAHFASNAVAGGYWGEQGTVVRQGDGSTAVGRCGIYMFFCNSVNFYDNYFYGFDQVCINLQGGTYNCNIRGNAFSDIGDAAINIGHERHLGTDQPVPNGKKETPMVLTRDHERCAMYTSYIGDEYIKNRNYVGILNGNAIETTPSLTGTFVNKSYLPDSPKYKGYAWHSDPVDAANGEKSYVMFDFYSKFSLDTVILYWDNSLVSASERSNFEVLASNDMSFAPGTYKTLRTQNGSYNGETLTIDNSADNTKYRYLMIRTKGATPLALSQVYATTKDMKPYTYMAIPKNITVSNNYMTRIGGEIPRACAVMAYYVDGLNLTHNELFDIGYSGMEIGWGWSNDNKYTKNVYCAYNNIDTTNHFLYDGGPIYTLSRQENSVYEKNYLDNNILGVHNLYQDAGTAGTIWRDNVVENGHFIVSPYNVEEDENENIKASSQVDNIYENNYASHNQSNLNVLELALRENTYESAKEYAMGQPPEAAWKIINDSGLESDYQHLKALVPTDVENGLPEEAVSYIRVDEYGPGAKGYREIYGSMHKQEARNMLNGTFGTEKGQYPEKYHAELTTAYNNFPQRPTDKQTVLLRNLMNEIKESVKRKSLSETMAEIDYLLDNARVVSDNCPCITSFSGASLFDTFGMMKESEHKSFVDRNDDLYDKYEYSTLDKLVLLETAEELLADIKAATFNADIVSAATTDAEEVNIDTENCEVTFYFAPGSSLANKTLNLAVSPSAIIASNIPAKVDLSSPLTVSVYCTGNKGYKYWTVKGEYLDTSGPGYTKAENWYSLRRGDKHVSPTYDGSLIIQKGAFATMSKSYDSSTRGASLTFAPLSQTGKHNFTMVLASQGYEIDNELKSTTVKRLEIDFADNKATLYKVTSSGRDYIGEANTTLSYNSPNTISFSATPSGSNTNVTVKLNGQQIFSKSVSERLPAGYFGFMSKKVNIKIY